MYKFRLITLAALLVAAQHLYAQTPPTRQQDQPAPTRYALEVTYYEGRPPAYLSVPKPGAKAGGAWYGLFRRIPSRHPSTGSLPVKAVNVLSRPEGDAIRVTVSVFLGERFQDREETVATYLVRENERVSARELARFGVKPFEITAVRVSPDPPDPPAFRSDVQSISIDGARPDDSVPPSYNVSLQNLSGKDVLALKVEVSANGRKRITAMPQGQEGLPLIAAGASHEIKLTIASDARATARGYEPVTPPNQEVIITAAVFADGTYEGDARAAAHYRAFEVGRKLQVERALALMRDASDTPAAGDAPGLKTFEAQVSSLQVDVDMSAIDEMLRAFPAHTETEKADLKHAAEVASNRVRTDLLKELRRVGDAEAQVPGANPFREWLDSARVRFEKWHSRL